MDSRHIESSWHGAGLFPFNPKRALRTIERESTPELATTPTQPTTPSPFDAFDQVFINSSPPEAQSLTEANELLLSTIALGTAPSTPVKRYIQRLAHGTEQLRVRSIIHQHDADNLRSIVKNRTARGKGKRAILKGHYHIATPELHKAVVEAEKETRRREKKGAVRKSGESGHDHADQICEEEGYRQSESVAEDYNVVVVE